MFGTPNRNSNPTIHIILKSLPIIGLIFAPDIVNRVDGVYEKFWKVHQDTLPWVILHPVSLNTSPFADCRFHLMRMENVKTLASILEALRGAIHNRERGFRVCRSASPGDYYVDEDNLFREKGFSHPSYRV